MIGQELVIDARVIIEAFQLACRGNFEQILVPGLIFRQEHQVAGFFVVLGNAVMHPPRGEITLYPDDRLDSRFFGSVVEIDHPKHGAVIGDRDGGHAHLLGALNQLVDVAETIQNRVFGVDVKMDEGHRPFLAGINF